MSDDDEGFKGRPVPTSDADFNSMVLAPKIGTKGIPDAVKERFSKKERVIEHQKGKVYIEKIEKGVIFKGNDGKLYKADKELEIERTLEKPIFKESETNMWEQLGGVFTQDDRLGNLTKEETIAAQYYTDLAGDLMRDGYSEAAAACLGRIASILELSQSRGGFKQQQLISLKHEKTLKTEEPKKRSIFGLGKKQEGV